MDSHQAIYDAVRSRISGGNIGEAVERAIRDAGLSHYADMAYRAAQQAVAEYERPSAVFRVKVFRDGDQWCALYGADLQSGVAGFGDSPSLACYDFDTKWFAKIEPHKCARCGELNPDRVERDGCRDPECPEQNYYENVHER